MPETATEIRGVGHSVRRKEDPRFLRGKGNYIDDLKLPGMLYMDIVRSPYAHAKITSIDASEALRVPGVAAVVTGKDLEAAGLAWMPTLMSDTQMVLPTDHVVYQSQEVVVVVATSRYAAADGVAAVNVEYEPLPPVVDPIKALEADAPLVRPDKEKKSNHIWHWKSATGPLPKRRSTRRTSWSLRISIFHASTLRRSKHVAAWPASIRSVGN